MVFVGEGNQMELKGDMIKIDKCYNACNKSNADLRNNSGFDGYQILTYALQTNNQSLQTDCIEDIQKNPDWVKFATALGNITELPKMQDIIKKFPDLNVYVINILTNCNSAEILEYYQPRAAMIDTDYIKHLCKLENGVNLIKDSFVKYSAHDLFWEVVVTNMTSEKLFELGTMLLNLKILMSQSASKKLLPIILKHEPYVAQTLLYGNMDIDTFNKCEFFSNPKYVKHYPAVVPKFHGREFDSGIVNNANKPAIEHLKKQNIKITYNTDAIFICFCVALVSLVVCLITAPREFENQKNVSAVRFLMFIFSFLGAGFGTVAFIAVVTDMIYSKKNAKEKLN